MSEEEQKKDPVLKFKDLDVNQAVRITLTNAEPVATGDSKYGTWNLWDGTVNNVNVYEGRGRDEKLIKDYSGPVVFFPSPKLHPRLLEIADGKVGVEIEIKMTVEKGRKGWITRYLASKIADGKVVEESITPSETNLINDAKGLLREGYEVTEEIFLKTALSTKYGGNISETRAKELYTMLN